MTAPPISTRGAPPIQREIPIRNAWVARTFLRFYSNALNDWTPYVGGTDVRVRFSRFATGYDFSGYPSTLGGPFTMIETSDAGWYYYPISADEITAVLAPFVGQTVYQVVEANYRTSYFDSTTVTPLLVIDPLVALQ